MGRKYKTCDDSILQKFSSPNVTWQFSDLMCDDCYTAHQTGYYKNDVAAKKRTFTFGYSFKSADLSGDTNKRGEVDKFMIFVTGLRAAGVSEQQAFDCLAGAKPANIYRKPWMYPGCDFSKCVGEKI